MTFAAIVLAGGSGSRMGDRTNKPYLEVKGRPLLWYSLEAFRRAGADTIVVVARPQDRYLLGEPAQSVIVDGGPNRTASEQAGLAALTPVDVDVVMIHDAARPFLTSGMVTRLAERATSTGGAVPILDFESPVWSRADHSLQPAPANLVRAQTPQAFRQETIHAAYRKAARVGASAADTAEIVRRFSPTPIACVPGDPDLFKVTYSSDLTRVDAAATRWWQDEGT